ncbi:MAG: PIN domain-containing protein [Acidimicrobiales bacterium]|jgi:predicted nucleic acid-binding protein
MAYAVIYDACVLHDPALRDLLIRLATKRQLNLRAQWSEEILDEMVRSILERRPDLDPVLLARTKELMIESVPDCLVTGYEPLVGSLVLPAPKDRHILAAAIKAQAQTIVTSNLKDFPAEALAPHHIEALHPDEFVIGLIDLNEAVVVATFSELVADLKKPPSTVAEALDGFRRRGMSRTADSLAAVLL